MRKSSSATTKLRSMAAISPLIAVLLLIACDPNKESRSNGDSAPKKEAPANPAADRNRIAQPIGNPSPVTDEEKKADNSANEIKFDGPMPEEERLSLLDWSQRYTGAAEDDLRSYLITRFEEETNIETHARSLRFANSIITAKIKVSDDKKSFKVVLKIKDPRVKQEKSSTTIQNPTGKDKVPEKYLSFTGRIGDTVSISEKNRKTSSQRKIYLRAFDRQGKEFKNQFGTLECVDSQSNLMLSCQSKVATISLNGAVAKIIFRSSDVNLAVDFKNQCLSQDCEKVYELFRNTEYSVKSNNRIRSRVLESFEVIHGRSAFTFLMLTFENEILKIEGELSNPLHARFKDTEMEELMNQKLTAEELKDPQTQVLRKIKMNTFLKSIRLVKNEGNGVIQLIGRSALDKEAADLNLVELSISRVLNPIRTLQ
jgi:hypothetical protein